MRPKVKPKVNVKKSLRHYATYEKYGRKVAKFRRSQLSPLSGSLTLNRETSIQDI